MKKQPCVLLFGKNGQVGYELRRALSYLGNVYAIDIDECDLTSSSSILRSLDAYQPDIIVNAAAYTAVDKAEKEPELAEKLNSFAPKTMSTWAADRTAWMIHYSTDYVFDGQKDEPYTEEDFPNPLNTYGKTKLQGDTNIQTSGCNHLIFRTSWVYGGRGKNFYLTMRKLLQEEKEVRVVNDQFGTPTWCRTIADVTGLALMMILRPRYIEEVAYPTSGIYNLTNDGITTWFEFAQAISKQLGLEGITNVARLSSLSTQEYAFPTPRPLYSALSTKKLTDTFGITIPHWKNNIEL